MVYYFYILSSDKNTIRSNRSFGGTKFIRNKALLSSHYFKDTIDIVTCGGVCILSGNSICLLVAQGDGFLLVESPATPNRRSLSS